MVRVAEMDEVLLERIGRRFSVATSIVRCLLVSMFEDGEGAHGENGCM